MSRALRGFRGFRDEQAGIEGMARLQEGLSPREVGTIPRCTLGRTLERTIRRFALILACTAGHEI
jgi:hypothetical protein